MEMEIEAARNSKSFKSSECLQGKLKSDKI